MNEKNKNIGIEELDLMFTEAFIALHEKGYDVDNLCICRGREFYKDYKQLSMDFIVFKDIVRLASIPIGFELAHIMDEEYSILLYKYEDNLSRKQVLRKKTEVAAALLLWVLQLPFNDEIGVMA